MTEKEAMDMFRETGALLEGHFELRSKLHSNRYFQCANVLKYPRKAERLCAALVENIEDMWKAKGARPDVSGVVSPAVGGIIVGHEVARALDLPCVFAEKVQGEGVDASGKPNTVLAMRRFALEKGGRYIVAEDVVTKGGRVQETIDLVKAAGAEVEAVAVLVDRSGGKASFGDIPFFSLVRMTPETWTADACPMCKTGSKPVHPGS
ncbi:MAG: orotate phosphoribosyltransferase [Kiritimatiellae bacterium]|nr:orotate phosphoribosyltransferase [Kiritimatiellia bacterium]